MLLANDAEADALREGRPLAALEAYATLAVVKQGPGGASAYGNGAAWHAPAHPVQVVDTTGAGDAFDAAFIVEWLTRRDIAAALAGGQPPRRARGRPPRRPASRPRIAARPQVRLARRPPLCYKQHRQEGAPCRETPK